MLPLRGLFIIILLFGVSIQAGDLCLSFYSIESRLAQISILNGRLKNYLGGPYESLNAHLAHKVLNQLALKGTELDLKIFDLYLRILQETRGDTKLLSTGAYFDIYSNVGVRIRTHRFQEQNWDWEKLYEFFNDTPLSLDFFREQDIAYLEHVVLIAKKTKSKKTLAQILEKSNYSWAIHKLERFPEVRDEYERYQKGKSINTLYLELKEKYNLWIAESVSPEVQRQRSEQIRPLLESLRITTNSSFDLFLASRYLDAISPYLGPNGVPSSRNKTTTDDLTHPDFLSLALSEGNFATLNQVIFQNAHDYVTKGHVASILIKIIETGPENLIDYKGNKFQKAFFDASNAFIATFPRIPAPDFYFADLDIYSLNQGLRTEIFELVSVEWDPIAGRPLAARTWSIPAFPHRQSTLKSIYPLNKYVKSYFDHFRKKGTHTLEEIQRDEDAEMNSNFLDSTYFIFRRPHTVTMATMVRLFDATKSKTFIERELPEVVIPERALGEKIYELGRLYATEEAEGQTLSLIMARVAHHLKNRIAKGVIYFDAHEAGMKYYTRHGAKTVYRPDQLNQPASATPLWVMKYSVEDFIKHFLKPDYKTVRTRKRTETPINTNDISG
jgi:hypothetical protein